MQNQIPNQNPNYSQPGANPNPGYNHAYPPVQKSSSGCGCFMGCLIGCFGFLFLCIAGLAFLFFTVDFKGMMKSKVTNPDTVAWIYKTAKAAGMVEMFLPENLTDGEKLKIIDDLDKVMTCYPKLPEGDRQLILELTKSQNTQNLSAEQMQALLQRIQTQCGMTYEQMQNLGGKLK